MRRLVTISVLALASTWAATFAAAGGGAVWEFDRYQSPGDQVEATTAVAWGHNGSLGTPDDGPYFVYLAPMDLEYTWPGIPEESWLVGLVEVHEGPYMERGFLTGPHHAIARFEIPDIAAGSYQILHCNDPCTSTLGDIVGGLDLRVLSGTEGRPPEVIAAEVVESAKNLPLFYPTYSSTTVASELVSEPAVHPDVASPSDPVREGFAIEDHRQLEPTGPTRTATVEHLATDDMLVVRAPAPKEDDPGAGLAGGLGVALVVSVAAMAWMGWGRRQVGE